MKKFVYALCRIPRQNPRQLLLGRLLDILNVAEVLEQGGSAIDGKDSVGKDKAVQTAIKHAGLTSSQVTQLEAKLDRDGGKLVYEIEFKSGGYEYEYEINASNGSIIKSEKDLDD